VAARAPYVGSRLFCVALWAEHCTIQSSLRTAFGIICFSVFMARHEHLHAVQSYLVLCVYTYIYILIDHVFVFLCVACGLQIGLC
jgi:hypothetical protein